MKQELRDEVKEDEKEEAKQTVNEWESKQAENQTGFFGDWS